MAASKPLAIGAAVLAAVPFVMSGALSVCAADSGLEEWLHNYYYVITSPGFSDITDPAFGMFDYLDACIIAAVYGGWKNANPADMASISVYNGFYSVGGTVYSGALLGRTTGGTTSGAFTVFAGDSYDITLTPNGGGLLGFPAPSNTYVSWGSTAGYTASGVSSQNETSGFIYYTYGSIPEVDLSNPFNYIWTRGGGTNAILGKTRGRASWYRDFPSGFVASEQDAVEYIKPIVEDVVETYPELAPFVPDLEEPYTPVYPSEFAEGVPKSWTVENPRLPSYSLDLQLPTANFEAVDISEPLAQNANGIRFWWAMLGELFDHFGVKSVALLACALGLFVLILTRLGR